MTVSEDGIAEQLHVVPTMFDPSNAAKDLSTSVNERLTATCSSVAWYPNPRASTLVHWANSSSVIVLISMFNSLSVLHAVY